MGFWIQISSRRPATPINAFREFPRQIARTLCQLDNILYNSFTTRYAILKAMKAEIIVFWDVTPCNFDDDQRFGEHG